MTVTAKGHERVWVGRKQQRMVHDLVWEAAHGPIPEGHVVHHVNQDKLDNRLENLQLLDHTTHKRIHSGCELRADGWWKPCSKCGEMKPLGEYYKHREGWPMPPCKPCRIKAAVAAKRRRQRGHGHD